MAKRIRLAKFVKERGLGTVVRKAKCYWRVGKKEYDSFEFDLAVFAKRHIKPKGKFRIVDDKPDLGVIECTYESRGIGKALELVETGIPYVWLVDVYDPNVYEFRKNRPVRRFGPDDRIKPPAFLKGFSPKVKEWFKPYTQPVPDTSKKTLFRPSWYDHWKTSFPDVSTITDLLEDARYDESELGIFRSLLENEYPFMRNAVSQAYFQGDVEIRNAKGKTVNALSHKRGLLIPFHCEDENIEIERGNVRAIIVVEKAFIAFNLMDAGVAKKHDLLLIASCGIPRIHTRRFLHRLRCTLDVPVYVLADNDTWGYYIFSVMKRGMMAPYCSDPLLAVPDVRFLGGRARETRPLGPDSRFLIRWRKQWDLRLKAMSGYPCFSSGAWRREFENFRKQNGKFELECLPWAFYRKHKKNGKSSRHAYRHFAREYIARKLDAKDWLS